MTAISILQMTAMADDSLIDGKAMWATMLMACSALDHAIQLLIQLLPYVEHFLFVNGVQA